MAVKIFNKMLWGDKRKSCFLITDAKSVLFAVYSAPITRLCRKTDFSCTCERSFRERFDLVNHNNSLSLSCAIDLRGLFGETKAGFVVKKKNCCLRVDDFVSLTKKTQNQLQRLTQANDARKINENSRS